ncbi:MAG: prepilin peptidase [Akkermansia sp.]|nr:prepilin peptidase [Akkermansia sp.]
MEEVYTFTQGVTAATPWLLPLFFGLFGACVGSFLNVVIYRMPRGLSVNEPRRSFCPQCKAPIPWYLNLPVLSYLMLRGRTACCGRHYTARYCVVELVCALLFAAIAWYFCTDDIITQVLLCVWVAAMLACFCIDWEQMVVLPSLTLIAAAAGVGVSLLSPWFSGEGIEPLQGLMSSLSGAFGGFLLFRLVALTGKFFFGRRQQAFDAPQEWLLRQAADGEDVELLVGGERLLWSDLFMESSNRFTLLAGTESSHESGAGELVFTVDSLTLPDGTKLSLEEHDELRGTCRGYAARKEAMGSGDAWLALAIGALCGWQGVVFALVGGSFIGIGAAVVARIGRGTPMPFGPALIAAACIWLFWGTELAAAYQGWLETLIW